MTRPLRNRAPEVFRLINMRTVESRLWLHPSESNRRMMGGVLARYQHIHHIDIFACSILSNHLHLLVRAPRGNIADFCADTFREIARRINYRYSRKGPLWGRRYDDLEVLTSEDLLEAFLYVVTNPTKHALVKDSREWTGLCSIHQALGKSDEEFTFTHFSKSSEDPTRETSHTLIINPLPIFSSVRIEERQALIRNLIEQRTTSLQRARWGSGKSFLGTTKVLALEPGVKPETSSHKHRPWCYSKSPREIRNFTEQERERRASYRNSSKKFRSGDLSTTFPPFTFYPPLHMKPRRRSTEDRDAIPFSSANVMPSGQTTHRSDSG